MADIVGTAAQFAGILKRVYGPRIEEQVNRVPFLYNIFDKQKIGQFMGDGWYFPALVGGVATGGATSAVGSRLEDDTLQEASPEVTVQAKVDCKKHYGRILITGFSMEATKTNPQAFITAKGLEMQEKTNWLISDLNRQCYGDSYGTMGVVLSDAANAITFDTDTNMDLFKIGMKIDIYDTTRTAKRNAAGINNGRIVETINEVTRTITYSGGDLSGTIVAGDLVFKEGTRETIAAAAEGKEMNGLRHIIDDGTDSLVTYQNISRTTYPDWRGNRLGNSGTPRSLSLDLMQSLQDVVERKSGKRVTHMIMGYGQRRNYLQLLFSDVRYEPQQLKGGFEVLKYNHLEVLVDKDATNETIFCIFRPGIKKFELKNIGVLDQAGAMAERQAQKDVYEMLIGGYFNLGSVRPNSHGRLVDLAEP